MSTLSVRVHVRQWRALIWLGTLALGAFCVWNGWSIFKKHQAKKYVPRQNIYFEQLISAAVGSIDEGEVKLAAWSDYAAIARGCPINGYEPPKPEPKVEPQEPEKLPEKPISDVLTVTAITSAPDDLGRVVVKYKDETVKPMSRDEVVLSVGAPLAYPYEGEPFHGRLKAIKTDSAIFDWCGKDVVLHPMRKEEAKGVGTGPEAAKPVEQGLTAAEREQLEKNKNQKKSLRVGENTYLIGSDDYKDIAAKPDEYLREARISDVKGPNGQKEVVVGQIRPNGYLARTYDIQPGDAIISINGVPVTSRAQALNWARENVHEKYVVVMRRKGREVTKTILVPRDDQ